MTVGVDDHFLDLGGNSLIATQVISRLRHRFRINVPLTLMFEAPTVAGMAVAIELAMIDEIENIEEEQALELARSEP
jgi:acyl carrier protein